MSTRRMIFIIAHAASIGVLVGTGSYGLAAFVAALFIENCINGGE